MDNPIDIKTQLNKSLKANSERNDLYIPTMQHPDSSLLTPKEGSSQKDVTSISEDEPQRSPVFPIVVASRPSKLAMIQTQLAVSAISSSMEAYLPTTSPVRLLLRNSVESNFVIQSFKTLGDQKPGASLNTLAAIRSSTGSGASGIFSKEVEDRLMSGEASVAVHSLKDLPSHTIVDESENSLFDYPAILKRGDPRDALVVRSDLIESLKKQMVNVKNRTNSSPFNFLPIGSVIGTSAVRRKAFLRHSYSHLTIKDIRGNVDTRLEKLENQENQYDGLILASAGLERLQLSHLIFYYLNPIEFPYSPGQGALVCQCLNNAKDMITILQMADHIPTRLEILAERQFMASINGQCQLPLGVVCQCRLTNACVNDTPSSIGTNENHIFDIFVFGQIGSSDGKETYNAFKFNRCRVSQSISQQLRQQQIRSEFEYCSNYKEQNTNLKILNDLSHLENHDIERCTIRCSSLNDLFNFVKNVGQTVAMTILHNCDENQYLLTDVDQDDVHTPTN